jgi:hypothetical protein
MGGMRMFGVGMTRGRRWWLNRGRLWRMGGMRMFGVRMFGARMTRGRRWWLMFVVFIVRLI